MHKAFSQFKRPSEAVVYWALENLCTGSGGRISLSLSKLAKHCGLSVSTTNRAVLALTARGMIQYRRGHNQSRKSVFALPPGGETLPDRTVGRRTIGIPTTNDSDSDTDSIMGDNDIEQAVHRQNADTEDTPEDRLAHRIADGLDDLKNIALYKNYCRRYPTELILHAFMLAREPEPSKIKKSRGALFNWLVKKMYADQHHTTHHPGASAR